MTDTQKIADLLFPEVSAVPQDLEEKYPPRALPEGARVTRFSPSPTGYLHIGGLFGALADYMTAKATGGVFYLRIEDTDKKREIEDGVSGILEGLRAFGITPDEGVTGFDSETGAYGPYTQSKRVEIYHIVAKDLVRRGLAYPCFCTADELAALREQQEKDGALIRGYFGKYAKCRDLSDEEIEANLRAGKPYVLRFRSDGDENRRVRFDDIVRGKIEFPENIIDEVLLKSDGVPTYHFAHVCDDHFMRTTHVLRGEEWLSSVPKHIALFKACGFRTPKYAHTPLVLKIDEQDGTKRKISKRKDPEAAVSYFVDSGYPKEALIEYLMTLLNSNFEDWRRANPEADIYSFPFNLKKMSVSGALFDLAKLNDISKTVISRMDAQTVFDRTLEWAKTYDAEYAALLENDPQKALGMMALDRGGKKPRKDIAMWSQVRSYFSYMYPALYEKDYTLPENIDAADAAAILHDYSQVWSPADEKDVWFEKIKALCAPHGFTPNVKEYKQNPDAFKGHVGDVSTVIRIAVTGRTNTPDLCTILQLLGEEAVHARLADAEAFYRAQA
ncbi:MAG TPA: glutamate--tRNA ligase [Candidatus Fimenecus excrementavium]|nr:glutamate--tRNA ligase [Candidatus Fimenecus excrementavium]